MEHNTSIQSKLKILVTTLGTIGGLYTVAFVMVPKLLPGYVPPHLQSNQAPQRQIQQTGALQQQKSMNPNQGMSDAAIDERIATVRSSEKSTVDQLLSYSAPKSLGVETVKRKVSRVFPKMSDASFELLGENSGLVKVTIRGQSFLMSQDGNYLFDHSYVDISDVETGRDHEKVKTIELTDYYEKGSAPSGRSAPKTSSNDTAEPKQNSSASSNEPQPDETNDYEWLKSVAVVSPASNEEKGEVVIFTDYTCPVCNKFHPNYKLLQDAGYTLYTVPMSRKGKSGRVYNNTNRMYCDDDFSAIYDQAVTQMSVRGIELGPACDFDYAGKVYDLILDNKSPQIRGTPAFWLNGERFLTASQILEML